MLKNILNDPDCSDLMMVARITLVVNRIHDVVDQAKDEGKL